MCIRDRPEPERDRDGAVRRCRLPGVVLGAAAATFRGLFHLCLLYTSDAADERSSVDLGGRRIIKQTIYTLIYW